MSYPYIGMAITDWGEKWEHLVKWDAAAVEQLLRDGHHIFFEDAEGPLGTAMYVQQGNRFQFDDQYGNVRFESESFLEFAVWAAFMGRDFL